jgi:hypothetical protein
VRQALQSDPGYDQQLSFSNCLSPEECARSFSPNALNTSLALSAQTFVRVVTKRFRRVPPNHNEDPWSYLRDLRFAVLYWSWSAHAERHLGIQRPDLRGRGLNVFKESHETEIHVEILVAMKQCGSRVIGDKIDIDSAEAFDQDGIFENSGRFFSVDLCDLEIMSMQVERVHVVALVDENQSIAATLLNLDRLALLVRLSINRPDVESAFASVDFPNLHRNHFVWRDR